MKKCIVNEGAFEFPVDYFGEISSVNSLLSNWEGQSSVLNITTELNNETELARVDGDYMNYMSALINIEITSLEIVEDTKTIVKFNNYNKILDLSTDCPPAENLYRGTIRFGRSIG